MTRWELSGLSVWLRLLFRMNLIKAVQVDEGQSSVRGAHQGGLHPIPSAEVQTFNTPAQLLTRHEKKARGAMESKQ